MKLQIPKIPDRIASYGRPLARAVILFALTKAQWSGLYAPWTWAGVALAGSGLPGIISLCGAVIGGLVFFPLQVGLRHIAAVTLIYAASLALEGSRLARRCSLAPIMAASMPLLAQLPVLIGHTNGYRVLCVAASAAAGWIAHRFMSSSEWDRSLLLIAGFAVALVPLDLNGFSPGIVCGAWLLLLLAHDRSPSLCMAVGCVMGLTLDLAVPRPEFLFTALLSLGGVSAAVTRRAAKAAVFILLVYGTALLFDGESSALFFEVLVASAAYLITPQRMLITHVDTALPSPQMQSAAAFRALHESFSRESFHAENPSVLFDRAAEVVCRRCTLRQRCWQTEYQTTYDAFNHACPSLLRQGHACSEQFPAYFADRCLHFPELLSAIDRELHAFLLRRQYQQRLYRLRRLAIAQYAQMGELLEGTMQTVWAPETEHFALRTALRLRPRQGETLCGDQVDRFSVGGITYLLLSDGMGSGDAAHMEAALTIRLLRQFLEAGVEPIPALQTLNTAMHLRSDENGSFTTVDLLSVQRSTGSVALYKYGAAASYVRQGRRVSRFGAAALPMGLQDIDDGPEITRLHLQDGSLLVLVSDGITAQGDEWLQSLLSDHITDEEQLARRIMEESVHHGGCDDDCAVLVLRAEQNAKNSVKQV